MRFRPWWMLISQFQDFVAFSAASKCIPPPLHLELGKMSSTDFAARRLRNLLHATQLLHLFTISHAWEYVNDFFVKFTNLHYSTFIYPVLCYVQLNEIQASSLARQYFISDIVLKELISFEIKLKHRFTLENCNFSNGQIDRNWEQSSYMINLSE